MTGYKARTVLAKTAGLNFLASVIMIIWHIVDGRDPDGTLIALVLVLFLGGTIIAGIRRDRPEGTGSVITVAAELLDEALRATMASRQRNGGGCRLAVVPEAPESTPRRSQAGRR